MLHLSLGTQNTTEVSEAAPSPSPPTPHSLTLSSRPHTHRKRIIRCVQHNLRRGSDPSQETRAALDGLQADLALIQEPYTANSSSVRGFPACVKLWFQQGDDSPVTAIALLNEHLVASCPLASRYIVVSLISCGRGIDVAFINVYFPPLMGSPEFNAELERLSSLLESHRHAIIAGDFNCRHSAWGDWRSNANGRELHEFIGRHDLVLVSDPVPTCHTHRGSSAVDLTLATSAISARVVEWHRASHTLSDHDLIWFDVDIWPSRRSTTVSNWKFAEDSLVDWDALGARLTPMSPDRSSSYLTARHQQTAWICSQATSRICS